MVSFVLSDSGTTALLYTSTRNEPGQNWFGFLVPIGLVDDPKNPPQTIAMFNSWRDYAGEPSEGVYGGTYVFTGSAPPAASSDLLMTLVTQQGPAYRYLLWVDPFVLPLGAAAAIPFTSTTATGSVAQPAEVRLRSLRLAIPADSLISYNLGGERFTLAAMGFTRFELTSAFDPSVVIGTIEPRANLTLAQASAATGGFTFPIDLSAAAPHPNDFDALGVGVKYFYTTNGAVRSQRFPVLDAPVTPTIVPFQVALDPINPTDGARTCFAFLPASSGMPTFATGLVSDAGIAATLQPILGSARLQLSPDRLTPPGAVGQQDAYYATIAGGFHLAFPDLATPSVNLLPGLAATESLTVYTASPAYGGDVVTFVPGQHAHAVEFPIPPVNLSGTTPGADALLDDEFTTSWLSITPGAGAPPATNDYYCQSTGAPLFGNGPVLGSAPELLAHYESVAAVLPPATPFPFAAFGALAPGTDPDGFGAQVAAFEAQVLSPVRHAAISPAALTRPALRARRPGLVRDGSPVETTTPQGLLVTLNGDGTWESILLAQNTSQSGALKKISLAGGINASLVNAFETNQQFLVMTKWPPPATIGPWTTTFAGDIEIEGWPFQLKIGDGSAFGSYANVLIFKFCNGSLKDRVANPLLWTRAADFNDASNNGLTALATWLQAYIAAAEAQPPNSGYDDFVRIVNEASWTGILALKVDLDVNQLPPEIQSLVTAIDLANFNAHHLGIEVNPVVLDDGVPAVEGNSSLFGLIDYEDPAYARAVASGAAPNLPVAAAPGLYDFKVLQLRVLFANTEIRDFQSRAQVTINQWFDDPVALTRVGTGSSISNSIVLEGALQRHDGVDTYVFTSALDTVFELGSNVLQAVEIAAVQFNTVQSSGGHEVSRFAFSGYLNLAAVPGFDAFSFGTATPAGNGAGLYCWNLFLEMAFDLATPTARTFTFDASQISFDIGQSRARPGGLVPSFPLTFSGFLTGTGDNLPAQHGYLPVQVQGAPLAGLSASASWYALAFGLDMGTPGALASAAGWHANVILSWSSGSARNAATYRAWVGIQLPGASGGGKLLSLQGILKLSIGSIQFLRVADSGAYLLKLTQIALKVAGLTVPPSGSTIFFLFGDPRGGGASSLGWYAAYNKKATAISQ